MEIFMTNEFEDWYRSLNDEQKYAVDERVELLEAQGAALKRPTVGLVVGSKIANLKELRADVGRAKLRMLFVFDPWRDVVLLVGVDKAQHGFDAWYDALGKPTAERLFDR